MIFVDTGALLARFVARDQHHTRAQRAWKQLRRNEWQSYTSNFVLNETFTLLARRTTYDFAAERAATSWYLGHSRSCVRTLPMS